MTESKTPRETELAEAAAVLANALVYGGRPTAALQTAKERHAAEALRVATVIEGDKAYRSAEQDRELAELEIREGVFVNVADAVVPPTPELLAKGEFRNISVAAEESHRGVHARSVRTVRRIVTTIPARLHRAGKIADEHFAACAWYRDQYEASGLEGNVKTVNFDQRIVGGLNGGIMFSERQISAQGELRDARLLIGAKWRKFFDLVVIDDYGIKRAARLAKAGRDPVRTLRGCADMVAAYVEAKRKLKDQTER